MYTLKLEHTFSSAHQLTNAYDNKCNDSIHGHNWKVVVTIGAKELVNNMVIDFTKVKHIINKLDHKNLNEILTFEPTAENIAQYLQEEILAQLNIDRPNGLSIKDYVEVELFEGEKASIIYNL